MKTDIIEKLSKGEFPVKLPGHLIAGEWGFSSDPEGLESKCPSTGELLATSSASKVDIKNAINCAFEYHISDNSNEFMERIEKVKAFTALFKENMPHLIRAAIREQGKPLWEVQHDFKTTLFQYVNQSEL